MRIGNWPKKQMSRIVEMRAIWVQVGSGSQRSIRSRGVSSLSAKMTLQQADTSGIDAKLGRNQRQVMADLGVGLSEEESGKFKRWEDESFTPEEALNEEVRRTSLPQFPTHARHPSVASFRP